MKVTVVGAGAVGASCAEYIAIKNFASEVVILDIKDGFAEGKAMDLMQTASLNDFDTKIVGTTNDYSKTANSDICVITSGIPRKPGMTREELIGINKYRLAEALNAPISDVDGMVIGGHSDKGMVPLISKATRNSIKVTNFLSDERLNQVREDTKVGGATLTKLLGTSAWYAPGAAVSSLVHSIACDHNKVFPCSALLEGEYGLSDLCIGVPVVLGKNGIEEIIELDLNPEDLAHLSESADGVKKTNSLLTL